MRAYKLKLASNGRHCDWLTNSRRYLKSMLCDEIKFCASNTNNLSWRKLKNKRKDRFLIGENEQRAEQNMYPKMSKLLHSQIHHLSSFAPTLGALTHQAASIFYFLSLSIIFFRATHRNSLLLSCSLSVTVHSFVHPSNTLRISFPLRRRLRQSLRFFLFFYFNIITIRLERMKRLKCCSCFASMNWDDAKKKQTRATKKKEPPNKFDA